LEFAPFRRVENATIVVARRSTRILGLHERAVTKRARRAASGGVRRGELALAAIYFLALPFTIGSPARRGKLRDAVFGAWGRVSLACAGVRVDVRGTPPRGACFLVANHLVYLDIWVLAASTRAVFVAESGIARWPFFGFMARRLSIIFIDRANLRAIPEVNRRIEEALALGHVLALFPRAGTATACACCRSARRSSIPRPGPGIRSRGRRSATARGRPTRPPRSPSCGGRASRSAATRARCSGSTASRRP
jgi:1-acyl-sn-glycerol-3-phosphate acyltransferase